jgi:hypothetical protein
MFVSIFLACASDNFLKVHYRLPSQSEELKGRTVSLSFKDLRPNKMFLTGNAKKKLKDFSETFSLVVSQENNPGNLLGAYDVSSLFKEIFKQRLENSGVAVLEKTDQAEAEIEIGLKTFLLDLKDRKWILALNYQTNIIINQRIVSTQVFSGNAERLRVVGTGDAEKIVSDLLTDMLNKLDLEKLFRDAGF